MSEIHFIKIARNQKSTFDLSWTIVCKNELFIFMVYAMQGMLQVLKVLCYIEIHVIDIQLIVEP